MSRRYLTAAATAVLLASSVAITVALAHVDRGTFSAGEPGDHKKPARVVLITMKEGDGKMMFIPNKVEVKRGEQIRFILANTGALDHEFILATTAENLKHAEEMKKNPDMEHDDPNGKRVPAAKKSEIVWRFTRAGTFEYGCLIPGHREAGMTGTVIVKEAANPQRRAIMRKMIFVVVSVLAFSFSSAAQDAMVDGQVTKIDEAQGKITLRHGPLKKLDMDEPMTMVFRVQDPAMLKQVKVGDKIQFDAGRINGQITVTKIQKSK